MDRACWQLSWSPVEMMLATSELLFLSDQRKSASRVCVWRTRGKMGVSSRPCVSFCCAMWSAAEPRLTYSELALGRLAAFHIVSLRNAPAAEKKPNPKQTNPTQINNWAGLERGERMLPQWGEVRCGDAEWSLLPRTFPSSRAAAFLCFHCPKL